MIRKEELPEIVTRMTHLTNFNLGADALITELDGVLDEFNLREHGDIEAMILSFRVDPSSKLINTFSHRISTDPKNRLYKAILDSKAQRDIHIISKKFKDDRSKGRIAIVMPIITDPFQRIQLRESRTKKIINPHLVLEIVTPGLLKEDSSLSLYLASGEKMNEDAAYLQKCNHKLVCLWSDNGYSNPDKYLTDPSGLCGYFMLLAATEALKIKAVNNDPNYDIYSENWFNLLINDLKFDEV